MPEPQFNSTSHGCCAVELMVLPHESKEEFQNCYDGWMESYPTRNATELNLVEQLVAADWLNQRSLKTYARVEAELYALQPNPLQWTDEQHKALARFARYRTANQNAFKKAHKTLEEFHLTRKNMSIKVERLNMAKDRHQVFKQTHAPDETWEELLELQRKHAELKKQRQQQQSELPKSS